MRSLSLTLALMVCQLLNAQVPLPESKMIQDTIPFTLTEANNIYVQAVLNQKDTLDLMFHTAASSMTITTEAAKKLTSLNLDKTDEVNSWGGANSSRYGEDNTLQIGKNSWDSITVWENEHSGPQTDGKFGPDLFKDKVLEINFDQGSMIVHLTLPKLPEGFEKSELLVERGFMFLRGRSMIEEAEYENKFLIHSGFGGTLLYDDEFVNANKIGEKLKTISESELKDAYGNVLKTKKALLPGFKIGEVNFDDMPVGFFEGSIGRQKMSVMGGNLLKRFNIILDLQNKEIYLKPNGLMKIPFADS